MITETQALACLDDLDDYSRMDVGVDAFGSIDLLKNFIKQHEQMRNLLAKSEGVLDELFCCQ